VSEECDAYFFGFFNLRQQDLAEEQLPPLDGSQPPRTDSSTPTEKDILVAEDCFLEY